MNSVANYLLKNKYFIIAIIMALVAIGLVIAGFLVPPLGVIDGSVLTAVGEIVFLVTIFFVWDCVTKGKIAKIKKGDLEASISDNDNLPDDE